MVFTSKTGLFPVVNKKHNTHRSSESLDLKCTVTPAPLALRPLASLYNPFSPSCSILCNHPTIVDTKKVVKQTKYSVSESKFFEKYACLHCEGYGEDTRPIQDLIYTEEIFRRYTDTDSRPMTPALTLASGKSRGSRRCLTPDDPPKRTSLVVDLRKSHSQETLYYHGCDSNETSNLGNSTVEAISMPPLCIPMLTVNDKRELLPPLASPIILSRRSTNVSDKDFKTQKSQLSVLYSNRGKKSKCKELKEHELTSHTSQGDVSQAPSTGVRRRGKRRRNRGGGRLTSAILVAQGSQDPETQVAGIGTESVNDSSRNSVAGQIGETDELVLPSVRRKSKSTKKVNSFLDESILKYLHRDVDKEAIEMEFDPKRRLVLEEAYRTKPDRVMSEEVQSLIKELKITTQCLGSWLHIPNVLSRKNSQFSLPFDTYELEILTPMKYAAQYVTSKHSKQLLYLTVLQKFKPNCYEMPIQNLEEGLILMMGGVLTENKVEQFKLIMDWNDYSDHLDKYETLKKKFIDENDGYGDFDNTKSINEYERCIKFKTWCGLCAICERMYGKFKSRDIDPPEGIEVTDFSTIDKKLSSLNIHKGLVEVLKCIQTY